MYGCTYVCMFVCMKIHTYTNACAESSTVSQSVQSIDRQSNRATRLFVVDKASQGEISKMYSTRTYTHASKRSENNQLTD